MRWWNVLARVLVVTIALTVLATPTLAQTEAASRAYRVVRYTADLDLDVSAKTVHVDELIELQALADLREVEFDLQGVRLQAVRNQRESLSFDVSATHVTIHFRRPLKRSRREQLHLALAGAPDKGIVFAGREAFTVYNTSHWLAVDHRPGDLARFTLSVTVPAGLEVIANGRKVRDRAHGERHTSTWISDRPAPDFVLGFAAGPFQTAFVRKSGVEYRYASATLPPEDSMRAFELTPRALAFYARVAGRPYPFKSYATVLVNGNPEQELATFTLLPNAYGRTLLEHPEEAWLEAHELAHQWWGIGVGCADWSEFWLNEGMATFMADVFLGEVFGKARYEHEIAIAKQIYSDLKAKGRDHALCYIGHGESEVGGRLPYFKGAVVLDLLKSQIGENAFWTGMRLYTTRHWGKVATSEDFEQSMEQACGHSLRAFFDEWVYR